MSANRLTAWLACLLLAILAAPASLNAETVALWGRWQGTFEAARSAPPPTQLTVDFIAPSGRTFATPGFWDGGNTWRVRFMPSETGQWRFRTRSVPAVAGLDERSGEFHCERSAGGTRFQQHGPVEIASNGRFFSHADGTPFLWVGDTTWYGAVLSSRSDWEVYLADRASKHFDVVHFNVVAPRNGLPADENGEVSFTGGKRVRADPDSRMSRLLAKVLERLGLNDTPVRINPRFYQRLDERIDAVNAHGLLAAIVLTWDRGPQDSGDWLPEAELEHLVRYLVARYQANQVVWILTGDATYEGANGERWRRVGRAVFDQLPQHAPVTTHPEGMSWRWQGFAHERWLDFVIYQSSHNDDDKSLRWIHSGPPSMHWQEPPPRPFINIEPPYEGHLAYHSRRPHSDYSTRRALYWSLLTAPTAGVSYGAHGVWSWHTRPGQPPTDHPETGVAKTWREALAFPGSTQVMYLEQFFSSIPWWRLTPDRSLIADQPDDPARFIAASRSQEGDLAVIYVPAGDATVRLEEHRLQDGLRAEWFDPRTANRTPAHGGGANEFATPDAHDWVLLLTRPPT